MTLSPLTQGLMAGSVVSPLLSPIAGIPVGYGVYRHAKKNVVPQEVVPQEEAPNPPSSHLGLKAGLLGLGLLGVGGALAALASRRWGVPSLAFAKASRLISRAVKSTNPEIAQFYASEAGSLVGQILNRAPAPAIGLLEHFAKKLPSNEMRHQFYTSAGHFFEPASTIANALRPEKAKQLLLSPATAGALGVGGLLIGHQLGKRRSSGGGAKNVRLYNIE